MKLKLTVLLLHPYNRNPTNGNAYTGPTFLKLREIFTGHPPRSESISATNDYPPKM